VRVADKDALTQIQQARLALAALHVSFSDQLGVIGGRALPKRYFLLLESMSVSLVRFVTLQAEAEVLAFSAIESEHELWDGLHTPIAAEPLIVPILNKLLLSCILGLFSD